MKKKKMKLRILCVLVVALLILGMSIPAMACAIDFGAAQDSANQAAGQIIHDNPNWLSDWLAQILSRWRD